MQRTCAYHGERTASFSETFCIRIKWMTPNNYEVFPLKINEKASFLIKDASVNCHEIKTRDGRK